MHELKAGDKIRVLKTGEIGRIILRNVWGDYDIETESGETVVSREEIELRGEGECKLPPPQQGHEQ